MAKGGVRPGAGRKKGSKSPATLEREAVLKAFRERAMQNTELLFNAQLVLARGQQFLYKIEKEWRKTGKGEKSGYWIKKPPKLVTAQYEIEMFLEDRIVNGDPDDENNGDTVYYFLTTKEPNNQAIDSILDRTFGRATQAVELGGQGGGPLQVKIINYGDNATS